jgi:hypothetical protein
MSNLSKHFYELDEVYSSLITSIFHQAPIETLFWAKELIDSSATSYLIEALVLCYALKFGSNRLEYINVLNGIISRKILSEYDLMRATYLLTIIDSSLISYEILGYLAENGESIIPEKTSITWLGRESAAFDTAMYYLMEVADPSEESLEPIELPELPRILGSIFNTQGRKRRFFSIRSVDLYGMCRRGFMSRSESTLSALYTAHQRYDQSIAWKDAPKPTDAYSDNDEIYNKWEQFTNQIFIDDIPDEWSLEDQMKSHGQGALIAAGVNIREWICKTIGIDDMRFDQQVYYPNILPNYLFELRINR